MLSNKTDGMSDTLNSSLVCKARVVRCSEGPSCFREIIHKKLDTATATAARAQKEMGRFLRSIDDDPATVEARILDWH
jgi:hypothetical protein